MDIAQSVFGFKGNKDAPVKPMFQASFHGETWYRCPVCKAGFEHYAAYFNDGKCPHCNQLLDFLK